MADRITNYQCPACTGPLRFDPVTGKLTCEYCGSTYDTAEIEALYAQADAQAAQAAQAAAGETQPEGSHWSEAEAAGLKVSGVNPDTGLVEIIELPAHPFFIATQFHPEYKSTPEHPQPLFVAFVKAALEKDGAGN